MNDGRSEDALRKWLVSYLAKRLDVTPEEIDPDKGFDVDGLGSSDAVSLTGDLEDLLGRRLSPTLPFNYPTVAQLASHLAEAR
jgi:acyl carrier protein